MELEPLFPELALSAWPAFVNETARDQHRDTERARRDRFRQAVESMSEELRRLGATDSSKMSKLRAVECATAVLRSLPAAQKKFKRRRTAEVPEQP